MPNPVKYRFTVELDLTEDVPREEDLKPGESLDTWTHEVVFRLINELKCHYLEKGHKLLMEQKDMGPALFEAVQQFNQKDIALAQQLQTGYTLTRIVENDT